MQLLHMPIFEAIGKRLILPISKANLFTCHIKPFFCAKPNPGYQFEFKIEALWSNGLPKFVI